MSLNRPRAFAQVLACAGDTTATLASRRVDGLREVDAPDDRARLKRVVRKRIHHAGARDGQNPALGPVAADVGHHADVPRARRLQQRRQAHADERRQIAARDLRRRLDRAVISRQARRFSPRDHRISFRLDPLVRLEGERVVVRLQRRVEIIARVEELRNFNKRGRVAGVERNGFPEIRKRGVGVAVLSLDHADAPGTEIRCPANDRSPPGTPAARRRPCLTAQPAAPR